MTDALEISQMSKIFAIFQNPDVRDVGLGPKVAAAAAAAATKSSIRSSSQSPAAAEAVAGEQLLIQGG